MTEETKMTVAAAPAKPIVTVRAALEKMMPQFHAALPKHITPERMVRVALTAIQNTPKLLDCDRQSLYSAIMRSAQLGLEPDGILGQAYLIPYGNQVQFIAGYKGLIDLARRSGEVSNIIAKEVYAEDEFSIDWSQDMPFTHKPKLSGNRGEITHFWALARFIDGGFHWDYMTREEVEKIRDSGNKNPVWAKHFVEMGKKTMIRRIAKYLPMSVQKAAITDELTESGKKFSNNEFGEIVIEHEPAVDETPPKKGNEGLKAKLQAKTAPQTETVPHDAETGEIIESGAFDASPIPTKTVQGDATRVDYDAWTGEFIKRCQAAPNDSELRNLYSANFKIMEQLEKLAPVYSSKCEEAYSAAEQRLTK
jgi:recombination protein RecT